MVIAFVDLEKKGRVRADDFLIIPQVGFVGGAHLDHYCTASFHHFRDAERAPNLHKLAPGDHDLTAPGQGIQGNEDSGRVVVHHGARFGAGDFLQDPLDVGIAASPFSPLKVIFQVAVGACKRFEFCENPFSEDGPAEVGVNDHACGID